MSDTPEKIYHGIAASPGIAIGQALVIKEHNTAYTESSDSPITPEQIECEIDRFSTALDKTREELINLQKRLEDKLDAREASIFDAHLLIVDDQMLTNEVKDMVRKKLKTADYAFYKVIERYVNAISVMPDQYIKERAADIKDVGSRILSNLRAADKPIQDILTEPKIIIARDLTPSDTALLDRKNVQAFAIETGSNTSHTAILARSMQIPAIVGISHEVCETINNNASIIIDGFTGTLIINPDAKTIELYKLKAEEEGQFYLDLIRESRLRPETIDGFTIQLASNIEDVADIQAAKKFGTCGVGLFRTEYMYLNATSLPSEETQFETYKQLILEMDGEPVIVRTLDIGGDKLDQNLTHPEHNPFLGMRAIRLCLKERPDVFHTQLRAILRASAYGNLKIMFPMISAIDEVREIKQCLDKIKKELISEKLDFNHNIETGIMIETPSAALLADKLAEMVDFFSIGTNDLVQYTIAIDRSNEKVAYLYQPTHPAILELIHRVVTAAKRHNIWVSVCGQMAGTPKYTPLLVGLGVHELSMSPISLGPVRRIIRKLRMHEAEKAAQDAMKCSTADEALEISLKLLQKISPEITNLNMD
ncbi:MAG: phosphoenolpyruvate--protein phosphotransferase [Victivallaceae bacterium]